MNSNPSASSSFIAANAMAVRLMEKGRHEEAYYLLKDSINRLQTKLATSTRLRTSTHAGTRSFYDILAEERRVSGGYSTTRLYSVPVYTGKARTAFLQKQQNIFSFYNKAFEVHADEDSEREDESSLSTLFIILAYNMGLALFIGSTLSGLQPELSRIQHNIRVFEAAMRALTGISIEQDSDLMSVLLALTFNLGYLHHLNYSFQETREHLSLALNLVQCPTAEETLSDDDYEFFYSSMCMFTDRGMELHLAPAA